MNRLEKINKAVEVEANMYRKVGHYSKMTEERKQYLLTTERDKLSREEKRLQTLLLKHGSIAKSMAGRNRANLRWGGKMGGRAKVRKGTATMDKAEHLAMSSKGGTNAASKTRTRQRTNETREGEVIKVQVDISPV